MANANFTPDIGPYTTLKPFRFWCQKVLPLVYDDSLSYYELLGKVVDYLNRTMEDVDTVITDIQGLLSAYEALQGWVNHYYDSADFAADIDAGLDRMAESGQLDTLLTPIVEDQLPALADNLIPESVFVMLPDVVEDQLPGVVSNQIGSTVADQIGTTVAGQIGTTVAAQLPGTVANQIGPVVGQQIGPVVEEKIVDPVEDWLDANVSGGIAVDRTLSVLGAGADAAFTGARLESVDNAVGYDHVADTGFIITTANPFAFNVEIINDLADFSDLGTHTYKMMVIPVNTGDKYCINAHKISIANISADHFAVTYAFCAKWIGNPETDTPRYLPTTYSANDANNVIATVPEIVIPTGQSYDETTGYLIVITADIEDPVYKVVDEGIRKDVNDLKSDFNLLITGSGEEEYLKHELLIYGSYGSGDTIGTPEGGGGQTRAAYGYVIPFSIFDDDTVFIQNSGGTYNISFVGFDSDNECNATPSVWLADGTYTLAQIKANSRATADSVGFSFQCKMVTNGNIPSTYADYYCSLVVEKTLTISADSIADDSITENKLSAEVRAKLNHTENDKTVDVIMFMGQSNMAGRGEVANAPTLIPGAGYEYRAISSPNTLSPMVEPFGATESNPTGIDEGSAKTGSMVVAFTNAYYTHNGNIPVVGISASKGGTPISDWQPNGSYLNDAIARLNSCVTYLTNNDYTIRHKYILWCQGETDGDNSTTATDYKTLFDAMLDAMITAGIEKLFMVRIGNYNYQTSTKYDVIMDCQTEIAQTETDVVMASTDFAGMRARGLMKDAWHYYQAAYNEVGTYSGINVAIYTQTGKEPTMYDTKDGTLYYTHKN